MMQREVVVNVCFGLRRREGASSQMLLWASEKGFRAISDKQAAISVQNHAC
jgi:hypothetical protein